MNETMKKNRRSILKAAGVGLAGASLPVALSQDQEVTGEAATDLHICKGLNTTTEGTAGPGECDCATAPAHSCAGGNTCAGLGACGTGSYARQYWAAENTCGKTGSTWNGTGGCGVPIGSGNTGFINTQLNSAAPTGTLATEFIGSPVWSIARSRFENAMVENKEAFGAPKDLPEPLVANEWPDTSQPFSPSETLPPPYPEDQPEKLPKPS